VLTCPLYRVAKCHQRFSPHRASVWCQHASKESLLERTGQRAFGLGLELGLVTAHEPDDAYPCEHGADGSGNRDSAVIVRITPDLSRTDTVARLAPLDVAEVEGEAGRRFERRVFSGTDQWGALSDGSVWVARVYHNRVDWRDPAGHWRSGDPLPDRVLEVTRADREMFVRTFPPELRSSAEQLPFSPVKPPFLSGFTSADGLVWLEKSRAAFDSTGSWHVVDRAGHLVREIRLPGFSRILAAGPGAALAVESDSGRVRALQVNVPQLVSPGVS